MHDARYPSLLEQLSAALTSEYRLERELGGGGMSRVYLAEQVGLDRRVVIKVLPPEWTTELSAERFRREVSIAARLQHPNIVPVITAGTAAGLLYYTMPFIAGESLRQRLDRRNGSSTPGLTIDEVVRILRDVARAIGYAHRHRIVHRDIKPENVLLSDDGVLVTDFGIAKAMADAATPSTTRTLSQVGHSIGTVDYMPPEQAVGDRTTDHRADIYAAGILAFEMLTGAPPFAGRTTSEVLAAHALSAPESVLVKRGDTPKPLVDLIHRCLAKRPADRPASADEMIGVLDALTTETRAPRRRSALGTTRGRLLAVGGLTAALLIPSLAYFRIPADQRALLPTLLRRAPPMLNPHRYFVATFENRTGNPRFDQFGFLIAGSIGRGLAAVPNIEVVDAQTRQINDEIVRRFPWLINARQRNDASAKEASAAVLITGDLLLDGDSLRVHTTMSDVASGALVASVRDVFAPMSPPDTLVARLTRRIVGTIAFNADTSVVAAAGAYSDAASPDAYDALRRGMLLYFASDTSMFALLRRAESLDSLWPAPTAFLAYIDAWTQRAPELAIDLRRADRLAERMTPAERSLVAYARALAANDLEALLPAAQEFMRNTPGSMESPLLVSSTALGLRRPQDAERVLRGVDPDRGLNLRGPYYWQSKVGLAQMQGNRGALLDAAREGSRRFPEWVLFRAYEARALAEAGQLDELDRVIDGARMRSLPHQAARMVVASHAASALAMTGRDAQARTIARAWEPVGSTFRGDTARWVQDAVARLALIGQSWSNLTAMEPDVPFGSGHAVADRLSYAAVGWIAKGDSARAIAADSLLAADHPHLCFGYRELARARIAAHRGQYDQAMRLLTQSVAEGIRLQLLWGIDFAGDPFLAPLRDYPPFVQLVAHVKR